MIGFEEAVPRSSVKISSSVPLTAAGVSVAAVVSAVGVGSVAVVVVDPGVVAGEVPDLEILESNGIGCGTEPTHETGVDRDIARSGGFPHIDGGHVLSANPNNATAPLEIMSTMSGWPAGGIEIPSPLPTPLPM